MNQKKLLVYYDDSCFIDSGFLDGYEVNAFFYELAKSLLKKVCG